MFGVLVFCFVVLSIRLFNIQITQAKSYKELASGQQGLNAKLLPTRGEIKVYDKYSSKPFPVATNVKQPLVYLVPGEITDKNKVVDALSEILGLESSTVAEKVGAQKKLYVPVKKNISKEEQEQVEELKLAGVKIDFEVTRFYPEQEMLSNVLGFTAFKSDSGASRVGVYGLERSFEQELSGKPGQVKSSKDANGLWLFGGKGDFKPPEDGQQLVLTVDRTVQLTTEKILSDTIQKHKADGGCIIVVEPKSGGVIAMASNPTFNPNSYNEVEDPKNYQNLCTQGSYEPGSVFKPLTMAAAIDAGALGPETEYVDQGFEEIAGYQIKNSDNKAHGTQNMVQVLEKSLNTGMIFVQRQMGNVKFKNYVEKFGFGKSSGLEVIERTGGLDNLKGNIELNYATASFGQGVLVTPAQMVKAYTALANKGLMTNLHFVNSRVKPGGEVIETKDEVKQEQVISAKTASTVSAMLVSVVENGHGKKAGVKGYYIAGKTGTAQVARKDGKGYDADNNIGTFIGYGPVADPQFVILVRIDHPRTVQFAENTAAPAFGELASFLVSYYGIPPTR